MYHNTFAVLEEERRGKVVLTKQYKNLGYGMMYCEVKGKNMTTNFKPYIENSMYTRRDCITP